MAQLLVAQLLVAKEGGPAVKDDPEGDGSVVLALLGGLLHLPSIIFMGGVGVLLAIQSPAGVFALDVKSVASSVFQVAGTFLALTLPAAQLSNALVTQTRELLTAFTGADSNRALTAIDSVTQELGTRISVAWRAVAYAFLSLLLASLAFLTPVGPTFTHKTFVFALDYFFVACALSSLIISSFWFLPLARYLFGLRHLTKVREVARILFPPAKPVAPAVTATAPGLTPAAPGRTTGE